MGIHQIDKIAAYIRYLQENSQELDLLFKELLIGVTSFFRDSAAWEELRGRVIPALLAKRPPGHAWRAWVHAEFPLDYTFGLDVLLTMNGLFKTGAHAAQE